MPSSKQQKGYRSNSKAREWLLDHGFTWIYFHPHPAHADKITVDKDTDLFTKDLFKWFDGMCFDGCNRVVFFQVKTNSWDSFYQVRLWCQGKKVKCIFFNVVDKKGVQVRFINYPQATT